MSFIKEKILHPLKMQWYEVQIRLGGAWWFFCKQQHQQEHTMLRAHYNGDIVYDCNDAVIFTCNGYIWHGGLADRLKGIVAVYDWCKRNNRQFQINFCEPFILQDYLIPNSYSWLPSVISYNNVQAEPRICLMEPRTCNRREVLENQNELLESWMSRNLTDRSHQQHVYTNMYRSSVYFSKCFNELFRPCERLQKEIAHHKQQMGGKYISISFRFTTLLGDFTDCTGSPLPVQERKILISESLDAITDIASKSAMHDKILVTADSETFLKEAVKLDNVYVIPGKVGHIDYDYGDDVNMKTFLDFLMIADAEAVYLAKGPGMYNSAFAKTAALVNDRPFNVYEY